MENITKFENIIIENGFDAAAVIPSPNFFWLTGKQKHLMERPTTLIVAPGKKPALIIAGFELDSMRDLPFSFDSFPFSDDPGEWDDAFKKAGRQLNLCGKRICVEPMHLRFLEAGFLKRNIPDSELIGAPELFSQLRLCKTETDTAKMRKAAEIAEDALEATLKLVKPGVTEQTLSAELVAQMLRLGSEPQLPFDPIVASGPNSADPHASVSTRAIQTGDFLLFDWGARYNGFCSDITRTFCVGEASDKQKEIYETVRLANQAGFEASHPDVPCGSIDQAARNIIEKKGYGKYFTHRVGHGLGLEAHEDPYLFGANTQRLSPGMSFTVEPGIYLPGFGGVRIEDDVTITFSGAIRTTSFFRGLKML